MRPQMEDSNLRKIHASKNFSTGVSFEEFSTEPEGHILANVLFFYYVHIYMTRHSPRYISCSYTFVTLDAVQ